MTTATLHEPPSAKDKLTKALADFQLAEAELNECLAELVKLEARRMKALRQRNRCLTEWSRWKTICAG